MNGRQIGVYHLAVDTDMIGGGEYAGDNWTTTVEAGDYPVIEGGLADLPSFTIRFEGLQARTWASRIGANYKVRETLAFDSHLVRMYRYELPELVKSGRVTLL